MGVSRLDDEDYPSVTTGAAADLLGVRPAFLRSRDAAGVLSAERSTGGQRRFSRRQLEAAARMRELLDEGLSLDTATRILNPQDQLDHARIDELEHSAADRDPPAGAPPDAATTP